MVPEGEEKEQEIGNLFEKIVQENFPDLMKEIDMQVQEAQRIPNKMDTKRLTPRHIIIKMPKCKAIERIFKAAREKKLVTYRRVPIRVSADFSKETLQARRDWQQIFKVMTYKVGTYSRDCSMQQSYLSFFNIFSNIYILHFYLYCVFSHYHLVPLCPPPP